MHSEDIARLLAQDNREKKRIGSNIFKRVSTRKGGTWMHSMRVPTKKELKELNGEVSTFNLNEILPLQEFNKKSNADQRMMMDFWRKNFKTSTIMEEMGIEKNKFYRILKDLGIQRAEKGGGAIMTRVTIGEEELNSYLENKNELLDYESFRLISSFQQDILLEEYLKRYESIPKLADAWKGANTSNLYYISSRISKKKKSVEYPTADETVATENKKNEQSPIEHAHKVDKLPKVNHPTETVDRTMVSSSMVEAVAEPTQEIVEYATVNRGTAPTQTVPSQKESSVPTILAQTSGHTVDVSAMSNANENHFSFSLNGTYPKESIIRRLYLLIEEINEAEEHLNINIHIKG